MGKVDELSSEERELNKKFQLLRKYQEQLKSKHNKVLHAATNSHAVKKAFVGTNASAPAPSGGYKRPTHVAKRPKTESVTQEGSSDASAAPSGDSGKSPEKPVVYSDTPTPDSVLLFFGNVDPSAKEDDIHRAVVAIGVTPEFISIRKGQNQRCHALVRVPTAAAAMTTTSQLDGQIFCGTRVRVRIAREQDPDQARRQGPRGDGHLAAQAQRAAEPTRSTSPLAPGQPVDPSAPRRPLQYDEM